MSSSSDNEEVVEYPRDSFDRFGDDMVTEILHRRPITVSNLIEWEHMSKQVQYVGIRDVDRITSIQLTYDQLIQPLFLHQQCRHTDGQQCLDLNNKFRRHIMERLPRIRHIDLNYTPMNNTMTEILVTIRFRYQQLWPELQRIDGFRIGPNDLPLVQQIQPIQHLFRSIDVIMTANPKLWLIWFQHLEHLTIRYIVDMFTDDQVLMLDNGRLRSISCEQLLFPESFEMFVTINPLLTRLSVDSRVEDYIPIGPEAENHSLLQISRLQNLQQLTILNRFLYDESIGQPLAEIAVRCRQLRHLTIRFGYRLDNIQAFVDTIVAIKRMHQLKQLEVQTIDNFAGIYCNEIALLMTDQLTADQRLGLHVTADCWPRLRRLKLRGILLGLLASQQFFQEIHQTMPRLESLYCRTNSSNVSIDGRVVWPSLLQLSQLSRLVIRGPVFINITRDQLLEQQQQLCGHRRSKLYSIFLKVRYQNQLYGSDDIMINPLPEDYEEEE